MGKHSTPASILIVDDELGFREMLSTILTSQGYSAVAVANGVEAINAVQNSFFDLVLLDVKMPNVDGIEVLHFIKENYIDTQVIMLTGVDDVRIAVECMKLGAFHYLTKTVFCRRADRADHASVGTASVAH